MRAARSSPRWHSTLTSEHATGTAVGPEERPIAKRILDAIADLGPGVLHLAAFLLAFGETAAFLGFVVPGEAGLVVAGAAASRSGASLPTMIAAAAAGSILGDSLSYLVGRRWGTSLVRRWKPIRRRVEPRVERARSFFERRGGAAIFFGRWIGVVRGIVPAVAGTAHMPYRRFLAWNVLASVTWATAVVSAGYLLGRNVEKVVSRFGLAVAVVAAAGAGTWWLLHQRGRRGHPPARAGAGSG